jgi:hypothetical protein
MKRRALLAALAPLTAGCFGATRAEQAESTDSRSRTPRPTPDARGTPEPTPEATDTPTSTPEPTPEPTPEQTPEPTPGGDRSEAADRIDVARDRIRTAVERYTGDGSESLLDISAAASGFEARGVLLELSEARTAIEGAARAAATDDQRETVESLRAVRRFLTQATDLQAWLIDGHAAVDRATGALADGADEDDVGEHLDAIERAVEGTEDPLAAATDRFDPETTSVVEAVESERTRRKRTQFEHERAVLVDLEEGLSTIQSARAQLDAARAQADHGDTDTAEEAAEQATERLDEVVERLEELDDDPPSRADAFADQIEDALEVALDYAADAENLKDRYE